MKKKLITLLMVMLLGFASILVNPVSAQAADSQCEPGTAIPIPGGFKKIRIGDVDGFGFGEGQGLTAAYGGPVNQDGQDILTTRDFLPDFNSDGKISNRDEGDPFDNRSDVEIANNYTTGVGFTDTGSTGSEYTDLSLGKVFGYKTSSTYGKPFPGGDPNAVPYKPTFNFKFTVAKDKLPQGTDLFVNILLGDYDVEPAEVILTSADGSTTTQEFTASAKGKKDGRIQAAFVSVDFSQVFTDKGDVWEGSLNVEVSAPNDPYLAFDFAEIGTEKIPLVPCPSNKPPVTDNSIPDQNINPCNGFSFTIPDGVFSDPDGDPLTYTATLADGSTLPSWLKFDGTTGKFSGVPGDKEANSSLSIKVTASDNDSGETSSTFTLNVGTAPPFTISSGGTVTGTCVLPPDTNNTVTIPVKIKTPESAGALPLDVLLTQDLTGSFRDDLPNMRRLVPSLVSGLKSKQPDTRFGVAAFTDKPDDRVGRAASGYVYQTKLPLTANETQFQNTVNALSVIPYGGDYPEASLEALLQVAVRGNSEIGFRKGARHTAIVSTDDSYHKAGDYASLARVPANNGDAILDRNGLGEDYPSVPQVKAALEKADIVPIFLVTSNYTSVYQGLVNQLGVGTVVPITANSSNLVDAIDEGLENVNKDFTIVAVDDDYSYVYSIDPGQFKGVAPGSELTVNVVLKYSGQGNGDQITIRALGTGDLVIDTPIGVSF